MRFSCPGYRATSMHIRLTATHMHNYAPVCPKERFKQPTLSHPRTERSRVFGLPAVLLTARSAAVDGSDPSLRLRSSPPLPLWLVPAGMGGYAGWPLLPLSLKACGKGRLIGVLKERTSAGKPITIATFYRNPGPGEAKRSGALGTGHISTNRNMCIVP